VLHFPYQEEIRFYLWRFVQQPCRVAETVGLRLARKARAWADRIGRKFVDKHCEARTQACMRALTVPHSSRGTCFAERFVRIMQARPRCQKRHITQPNPTHSPTLRSASQERRLANRPAHILSGEAQFDLERIAMVCFSVASFFFFCFKNPTVSLPPPSPQIQLCLPTCATRALVLGRSKARTDV
jgi:hypothetical protein